MKTMRTLKRKAISLNEKDFEDVKECKKCVNEEGDLHYAMRLKWDLRRRWCLTKLSAASPWPC